MAKQLKRPPAGLVNPHELPWAAEHLWEWFIELHATRQWGMAGPHALTWSEMTAWSRITGASPHQWEWRVLRGLDSEYLRAYSAEQQKRPKFKRDKAKE